MGFTLPSHALCEWKYDFHIHLPAVATDLLLLFRLSYHTKRELAVLKRKETLDCHACRINGKSKKYTYTSLRYIDSAADSCLFTSDTIDSNLSVSRAFVFARVSCNQKEARYFFDDLLR